MSRFCWNLLILPGARLSFLVRYSQVPHSQCKYELNKDLENVDYQVSYKLNFSFKEITLFSKLLTFHWKKLCEKHYWHKGEEGRAWEGNGFIRNILHFSTGYIFSVNINVTYKNAWASLMSPCSFHIKTKIEVTKAIDVAQKCKIAGYRGEILCSTWTRGALTNHSFCNPPPFLNGGAFF